MDFPRTGCPTRIGSIRDSEGLNFKEKSTKWIVSTIIIIYNGM